MFINTVRALFGNWPSALKTIALAVPLIYLLYAPTHSLVKILFEFLGASPPQSISYDIGVGIATDILSAFVLASGAYIWYKTSPRFKLNGKYKVEITHPTPADFGEVYLLVTPFSLSSNGVLARLRLVDKSQTPSMKIDGIATIINNSFLIGHYAENLTTLRRRCGTMFYTLDGTGREWSGPFTYIDPATGQPTHGTAKWIKLD